MSIAPNPNDFDDADLRLLKRLMGRGIKSGIIKQKEIQAQERALRASVLPAIAQFAGTGELATVFALLKIAAKPSDAKTACREW